MRIICPTCASHYEVDSARLSSQGQLVRCARCRDVWLVRPTDRAARPAVAEAVAPPAPGPSTEVIDFHAARVRLRQRTPPAAKGRDWATSFSVATVGIALLSSLLCMPGLRGPVLRQVPGAARAMAALGLPTADPTLALSDLHSAMVSENGENVLTLQGRIANTGAAPAAVPNLTVVVRDGGRLPLYTWTAAAPKPKLASGETIDFRSRLASPPAAGHDVRVSFAQQTDASSP